MGVLLIICAVPIARLSNTLSNVDSASSPQGYGTSSTAMGVAFLAASILLILLATCRFLTVQQQIKEGAYRPSSVLTFAFLGIILLLVGILTLHLLFVRVTP